MIRNPYVRFLSLLPRHSKWIGKVAGRLDEGHIHVNQLGSRAVNLVCECDQEVQIGTYVLLNDRTVTTVLANADNVLEIELVA